MATLKVTVPEGAQNIIGVATIEAPREKVFQAYTDPTLFTKWWGRGHDMKVFRFDCREGGGWHVAECTPDGKEHVFMGAFHEVTPHERIVQTFEYLGLPERGHVFLERADFVALDANTTEVRSLSVAQSREERDGMLASGMEQGWGQSVEALGKLLES